ncbi:CPBP family intramembrane glutamic endopeptidase [Nocardioides sp. GY 10113]|uniref:CPBP family intramembrane glutamic endopeptidase n=1 Tax=Nocardioides sp. GY 10113 TaxID=2569761 RepID=UPI001458EBCF|nr:CPBP family intramembrane glutamic endopeptidase [Nocardioides sp. GY 10113]
MGDIRTSPLVLGAYEARRKTHWLVAWVISFVVGVIIVSSVIHEVGLSVLDAEANSYRGQWVELLTNAGTLLVLFLWLRLFERRPFASVGLRGRGPSRLAMGFAGGIGIFIVPVLVLWGTGQLSSTGSAHTESGVSALLPILLLIPVWIVQGSTEEIVTRGYLLQNNATQLPGWLAVVLVSVGFGVVHLEFSPIPLLTIIVVSLAFVLIALADGSLWLVCGLHAGWNFAQGNVFGIPVSGVPRDVSLLTFGPAAGSNDLLTGGEFGVEASLLSLVVWALIALLAFPRFRRAQLQRETDRVPLAAYEAGNGASTDKPEAG